MVEFCRFCRSTKIYEYRRVDADGRRLCHCLACSRVQLLHRGDSPAEANHGSVGLIAQETAVSDCGKDRESTARTPSARVGRAPRLMMRGVQ